MNIDIFIGVVSLFFKFYDAVMNIDIFIGVVSLFCKFYDTVMNIISNEQTFALALP